METEARLAADSNVGTDYQMLPPSNQKFPVSAVKDILHTAINETLLGKTYDMNDAQNWSKSITSSALAAVKELVPKNFKIVVQVVLGQNDQGAGVRIVARCLWDASTDDLVSQIFTNFAVPGISFLHGYVLRYLQTLIERSEESL